MVCGCVLHRGQRGEGWCVSSTLCRYDIRMGLLLVRSWARVRRVSLGRINFVIVRCRRCEGTIQEVDLAEDQMLNSVGERTDFYMLCRFFVP